MDLFGNYQNAIPHVNDQRFRVIKSLMVESGTYNQEFTRPYTTNMDSGTVDMYIQQTDGGKNVNRGTLAGIASSIVTPSSTVDAQVNVSNGWNERRIIFMMEILEINTKLTSVIMGYGDKVDLSLTGIIDPELCMTFNSTITLNTVEVDTPNGIQYRKRVVDNAHLMGIQTMNALTSMDPTYNQEPGRVYMQRPTDIANNLSLGYMSAGVIGDGRTQLVPNRQTRSKRSNNSAPIFLSEVINGISQTAAAPEMQEPHIGQHEIYTEAAASMRENGVHNDPILRYITNNSNMNNLGFVTWGNMCQLFPDLDGATMYYRHTNDALEVGQANGAQHFQATAGNSEYWNVVRWESILATTIFHTLPSLISQCMLMGISGTMTNDTVDGVPSIGIEDARAFVDGFDRTQAIHQIEHRLIYEVMPGLTMNNQRTVFIGFNINLVRDGWVSISIDGQPPVVYSSPCFADGLLIPTLATNANSLATIATNVNTLVSLAHE